MNCTSCGNMLPSEATFCPTCGAPNSATFSSPTQAHGENEPGRAEETLPVEPGPLQESVSLPQPQEQPPQPGQTPQSLDPFSSSPMSIDMRTTGYGPAYRFPDADAQAPQPFPVYQQPSIPPAPTPAPFPPAPTPFPPAYTPAPFSPQPQFPSWPTPPPPPLAQLPAGGVPPIPPISPVPPVPRPSRRGLSKGTTILIGVLAVLLIIAGSGLIYYSAVYHPAQLHAEATATVQAIDTEQAHMTATANAQATSTAIAEANATATANAQATAQAVATATALANIYSQATGGAPALNDPLSYPNNWVDEYGTSGGGCNFSAGAYHITEPTKGYFLFCPAPGSNFGNVAFQVKIDMITGDFAGIGIRDDESTGSAYYFTIYPDGSYDFSLWKNRNGSDSLSLQSGNSPSIKSGHNQTNLVTIIARNHTFYLYVNKHFIASAQDSSFSSGEIGFFAGDETHPADVAFSNAEAWNL